MEEQEEEEQEGLKSFRASDKEGLVQYAILMILFKG